MELKKIKSALISVFYKDGLEAIAKQLHQDGVEILSTGGTQSFLEDLGIPVTPVEEVTSYPSILGGRVKTLHPKVFGGILARRELKQDMEQLQEFEIPEIDLVIVDLYPFEETVASTSDEQTIIEKVDIGGISLIRAAAKNFKDTFIVSSRAQYTEVENILKSQNSATSLTQRKQFAAKAFRESSNYDTAIFNYFNQNIESTEEGLKISEHNVKTLRYGENPHQKGHFYGDLDAMFDKLHGKELSYNNLLDVDAAIQLVDDFPREEGVTFAILKHNNACGLATAATTKEAYEKALEADPVSAFGGVLICNEKIDLAAAELINALFCEVLIAPAYDEAALELLKSKKNRVILVRNNVSLPQYQVRTLLNGFIGQDKDQFETKIEDLETVTKVAPTDAQKKALLFASRLVKNTKSNAIILANENQLLASGTGQTSRVDALRQAIAKAKSFNFDLNGAVMASDAFFPFPDCVEIANLEGIKAVIQPGGSIKDQLSIDYCNENHMAMVFTGRRHFKH